jgi:hypothetical protein
MAYVQGSYFDVVVTGCDYGGTWAYHLTPDGCTVSFEGGPAEPVDLGWTLPGLDWLGPDASAAGTSYLNWMKIQPVDWWKVPPSKSAPQQSIGTWMWFNHDTQLPFRLMYGQPPPKPTLGDPTQLPLFQMFSFTYFTTFMENVVEQPPIQGFNVGDPIGFGTVLWNPNFGMTTLMTPVDFKDDPLPTRVLYRYMPDEHYLEPADRAQNTLMSFAANPQDQKISETALMYGHAPDGIPSPPPYTGNGFIISKPLQGKDTCHEFSDPPLAQEKPDWAEETATVHATILGNYVLGGEDRAIVVMSALFPADPKDYPLYPLGFYLWTWYSPIDAPGTQRMRPVTFMESASPPGVGTNLALADYFDYQEFSQPIPPGCFAFPTACEAALPPPS